MAGFRLTKPYTMPKEEVREAAQGLANSLERDHGVRSRWDGDKVRRNQADTRITNGTHTDETYGSAEAIEMTSRQEENEQRQRT